MTQIFPFTRAKAIGWAFGEIYTSAQCNTMDANAAQAADGLLWSDAALAQNWFALDASGLTRTRACAWDDTRKLWLIVGDNGTNPEAALAWVGGAKLGSAGAPAAGAGLQVGAQAACIAPNGNWVFAGTPGSSSQNKIRQSADGGANWNNRNTAAAANTAGISVLHTFTAAGLIVAGFTNGDIETSPDGITWTARAEPNASARSTAASSPSICVVTSTASTDKVISSPDGVTWTERTLPSAGVWQVAYAEGDAKFIAVKPGGIAASADGISWSATGLAALTGGVNIAAVGKIWVAYDDVAGDVYISVTGGASWAKVAGFNDTSYCFRAGNKQLMAVSNTASLARIFRTLALGGR
jgi:hypothetical protein